MTILSEKKGEWLSVRQYSQKIGKSRTQVYLDIRLGKIKEENIREAEFINKFDENQKIVRKQILWEE